VRVLLSTYDSRGGIEPLLGLAAGLRAVGAEVRMCAPPDCAERLAEAGVPLVPVGDPVRALVHGAAPPSMADVPRRIAELIAAWFDKVTPAAEGCDALVASGLMPAAAGARSVAEKLGIHSVHVSYCPIYLPSPHHRPSGVPGRSVPPDVTDPRVLNDLDIQNYNAVYGPALNTHRVANGLPPVDNVRDYIIGDHPWLAADPILAPWQEPASLDVVQTGAWFVPDERPLPAELEAFLDAGPPPVYVGFGSMRAPNDIARVAIEAIRARGHRALVARGWAGLALIDDAGDCFAVGEVNHQALFGRVAAVVHHGGAGTTDRHPGRRAPGGGTPVGGPAVLGRPGGRPGHRRGTRRSGSDHRVPVSRARHGPGLPDPRAGGRRGEHDPHRRGSGGREAAGRRGQPGKAAGARVNYAGSPNQDPGRERPQRS
jgi:vancomycin aglycone glucosyltransferase